MSEQLRLRGDVAGNVAAYNGPSREVVVDVTNNRLVLQDGVTTGGWAMAKLAEVSRVARTAITGNYSAVPTDRLIAVTALTGGLITVALPAAASFQAGARLLVIDESGIASYARSIIVAPQGTDVVAGQFSASITSAYGYLEFESNGVGQWTMTDGFAVGVTSSVSSGPNSSTANAAVFSGQAIIPLAQSIQTFVVVEPRLRNGQRPVISALNPLAASKGFLIQATLTGFSTGQFSGLALVTSLEGKIVAGFAARSLLTLNYVGA